MLAGLVEGYSEDCRRFATLARKAQFDELHIKFGLTWEEFCTERLHTSPEIVDAVVIGVEVLGESMPIPAEVAERVGRQFKQQWMAKRNKEADTQNTQVRPARRPTKEESTDTYFFCVSTFSDGHGNAATYAMRRLAKDRPDLHAECLAGAKTPHAA